MSAPAGAGPPSPGRLLDGWTHVTAVDQPLLLLGVLAGVVAVLLARRPAPALDRAADHVADHVDHHLPRDARRGARPAVGVGGAGGAGTRAGGHPRRRRRAALSALTGAGAALLLGGPVGIAVGVGVAITVWRVVSGLEPAELRRDREAATRELPVLVDLLASALAAGSPADRAVDAVCEAWPGAAADRLARPRARLALGVDPLAVWEEVATDDALGPLGRALARAASSGAPVADAVARLADDLAEDARAGVEDRARTVGVRAAVPLGLCLLPAFVLLGIVPLAAGLLGGLL